MKNSNAKTKSNSYKYSLIAVARKLEGSFSQEEVNEVKKQALTRLTDSAMYVERVRDKKRNREVLLLFDVYCVKELNLLQRLRNMLRKIFAAASGNVGVNPILIIIQ